MLTPDEVRGFALGLPGVAEAPHFESASFRVPGAKGRIFVTLPPGGEFAHVFVGPEEVAAATAEFPEAFAELWWGKQLSGVRVTLTLAAPDPTLELIDEAWQRRAPKKLRASRESN